MKSLKFDDLFEQSLKDWGNYVDIDQPIYRDTYDIEEKITRNYSRKKEAILIEHLNWSIYNALGTEEREGRLPLIKNTKAEVKRILAEGLEEKISDFKKKLQSTVDNYEDDLEWQSKNLHTKMRKWWSLWDMGLAKAYLDTNKEDAFSSAETDETIWKRWDNEESYERGEEPALISSDGRVIAWGDQNPKSS